MAGSADVLTAQTTTHAGVVAAGLGDGNPALWAVIIAAAVMVVILAVNSTRR